MNILRYQSCFLKFYVTDSHQGPEQFSHLDGLEVLQHLVLLEVSTPKKHMQVASLVQPVLNLAAFEVFDSL